MPLEKVKELHDIAKSLGEEYHEAIAKGDTSKKKEIESRSHGLWEEFKDYIREHRLKFEFAGLTSLLTALKYVEPPVTPFVVGGMLALFYDTITKVKFAGEEAEKLAKLASEKAARAERKLTEFI